MERLRSAGSKRGRSPLDSATRKERVRHQTEPANSRRILPFLSFPVNARERIVSHVFTNYVRIGSSTRSGDSSSLSPRCTVLCLLPPGPREPPCPQFVWPRRLDGTAAIPPIRDTFSTLRPYQLRHEFCWPRPIQSTLPAQLRLAAHQAGAD